MKKKNEEEKKGMKRAAAGGKYTSSTLTSFKTRGDGFLIHTSMSGTCVGFSTYYPSLQIDLFHTGQNR